MLDKFKNINAQATVEAAMMIPVIFLLILILVQPGIVFYDLVIMKSATAETCRVLATANDVEKNSLCEQFIRRRLGAIPQQDNFHVHSSGCSYEFNFEGSASSREVTVSAVNKIKVLPLINFFMEGLGMLDSDKCYSIKVSCTRQTQPS